MSVEKTLVLKLRGSVGIGIRLERILVIVVVVDDDDVDGMEKEGKTTSFVVPLTVSIWAGMRVPAESGDDVFAYWSSRTAVS